MTCRPMQHERPDDDHARRDYIELAQMLSANTTSEHTEIAQQLFVSVNTVKAHLKSRYRKLGVGGRRDAIRRSRALGLLP